VGVGVDVDADVDVGVGVGVDVGVAVDVDADVDLDVVIDGDGDGDVNVNTVERMGASRADEDIAGTSGIKTSLTPVGNVPRTPRAKSLGSKQCSFESSYTSPSPSTITWASTSTSTPTPTPTVSNGRHGLVTNLQTGTFTGGRQSE
jgi:hypothetical protein